MIFPVGSVIQPSNNWSCRPKNGIELHRKRAQKRSAIKIHNKWTQF